MKEKKTQRTTTKTSMAAIEDIPEDRFTAVTGNKADNLCFLCLKEADKLCQHCSIPFCSSEHFSIHYDETSNYCYPFRVLQRPEVCRCWAHPCEITGLEKQRFKLTVYENKLLS